MSLNNECTCKRVLVFPRVEERVSAIIMAQTPISSPNLENYYNKQETDEMLKKAKDIVYIQEDLTGLTQEIVDTLLQARDNGSFVNVQYMGTRYIGIVNGAFPNAPLQIKATDYMDRMFSFYINRDLTSTYTISTLTTTDTVDTFIDQALLEAKESGEFKGEKGDTAMVNLSIVGNKLVITNVELSQNNADNRRY